MEIQTQEMIQKKLTEEFKEAMLAAAETGNLAKTEGRLTKVIEVIEAKQRRIEEVKSLIAENQSKIKKADPASISALSKQRAEWTRELAEINEELIDLEKVILPDAEKERLEAGKLLDVAATMQIVHQKEALERDIIELFRTLILPSVDAWKRTFPKLCSGYRILSGGYPDLGSFEKCSGLLVSAMMKRPQQEGSMESAGSAKEEAKALPDTKIPLRFGVSQTVRG